MAGTFLTVFVFRIFGPCGLRRVDDNGWLSCVAFFPEESNRVSEVFCSVLDVSLNDLFGRLVLLELLYVRLGTKVFDRDPPLAQLPVGGL